MSEYNRLSGQNLDRVRSLTDGVFAVAMTLLVLDVRLPDSTTGGGEGGAELWRQLVELGPRFSAYLLSFTMLGTFWLAEHTFLERCRRSDRMRGWAALAFLFFVSTLPFAASTLAEHVHLALAVLLYWANLLGLGLTLGWQIWHADRSGLVEDPEDLHLVRRRLLLAQSLYAVAAAVSFLSPTAAIAALAVVQLFFIVSPRLPVRV